MADEDCWDVFGSDDDNDEDASGDHRSADGDMTTIQHEIGNSIASLAAQFFVKADAHVKLSDRVIGVCVDRHKEIAACLENRGLKVENLQDSSVSLDAIVILGNDLVKTSNLLHGGLLVTDQPSIVDDDNFETPEKWMPSGKQDIFHTTRRATLPHTSRCRWLMNHSVEREREYLKAATVALSAHEIQAGQLTESSLHKASKYLIGHGFCIIRGLMKIEECETWGRTVLDSTHSAAEILLKRDEVDIYRPHSSKFEPQAYRELSMREDLRLDLRQGPELSRLRSKEEKGNDAMIVTSDIESFDGFLRGNRSILKVLRATMNQQKGELFKGNLGRYNFGGKGPDGSFQNLRVSPVGGIVALPGCGDQAIHADTPHLFENIPDLPAHYINVFAPAAAFNEKVGGTAFVPGSHNLEFTAKHCGSSEDFKGIFPFVVRPSLGLGDVVLFDCRVLHFGMANDSDSGIERVLLYTNTTHAWFVDPKNWDDKTPVFD